MSADVICAECGVDVKHHSHVALFGPSDEAAVCLLSREQVLRAALAERDAQLADERARADRLYQDRYDLLGVKSTDGLSSSEWLMRTATAERKAREAEAQLAEARREIARCVERSATAVHDAIDEHESSICPEDVGCAELVASLQRQLAEARRERDEAREHSPCTVLVAQMAAQLREADAVIEDAACLLDYTEGRETETRDIVKAHDSLSAWSEKTRYAAWREA